MAANRWRELWWPRIWPPVLLGVGLLASWALLAASHTVSASLLPGPGAVGRRLVRDLSSPDYLPYIGRTLTEALCGVLLALLVALPLGWASARWRGLDAAVWPYLAASQALPAVAIAPLIVLWLGYGLVPIALLCALLVFFPVVLGTRLGIRSIDPELVQAAQLDGASSWQLLAWIEAPLAWPALLTGIRNGVTLSITGAVVGEFVMGGKGLGMLVSVLASSNDVVGLFATLAVLGGLAVALYLLISGIEVGFNPTKS